MAPCIICPQRADTCCAVSAASRGAGVGVSAAMLVLDMRQVVLDMRQVKREREREGGG